VNSKLQQIDQRIYMWFQHLTRRNRFVDRLALSIACHGPLFMLTILAIEFTFGTKKERWVVAGAIVAAIIGKIFNEGIRLRFYRQRPYHTLGTIPLLWKGEDASFPSNHASGAFALAFPLWLHGGTVGEIMLLFACLLALSRVYVGVHYITDVITGAVIGSLLGWFCESLVRWLT
jgi:undecaprenyl-diphosphatase